MIPILLIPPVGEPVPLADAKAWLRLDTASEDALVSALITSARMIVESVTRRALLTQTWRLVYDSWPRDGLVRVPLAPFQSIAAVRVYDLANVAQTVNLAGAALDANPEAARLLFSNAPPVPGRALAGIEIDVVAGYGAAASVPEALKQAIRLLTAHWYENRGDMTGDAGAAQLPAGAAALIAPYIRARLT